MRAEPIRCPWCRARHMPRLLCDAAKEALDNLIARADSFTMPTLEFEQPVRNTGIGAPGDQLMQQDRPPRLRHGRGGYP